MGQRCRILLRVFVDWVGDYEPLWELLENMPISIRNLEKKKRE